MGDGGGELVPWVLSIGGGIVATLIGTIGKLWTERAAERREHRDELAQLRQELEEANDRVVQLQQEAAKRSDESRVDHLRDLRRLAGLSSGSSGPWPAIITADQRREITIRESPSPPAPDPVVRSPHVRAPPPAKKPR